MHDEQGSMIYEIWTMNNEKGSNINEEWMLKNEQGSMIHEQLTVNRNKQLTIKKVQLTMNDEQWTRINE